MSGHGRLLAQYEASLAGLPGDEDYPPLVDLPAPEARARIHRVLSEVLCRLSAESPVILVLDDLQWADDLVLGFLRHLIRTERLERHPLLILGTYRSEETTASRLIPEGGYVEIDLERLDRAAVGEMVAGMLALPEPPPPFVDFLTRHSEGNPFVVAEYLRTAVAESLLHRDAEGRWRGADASREALEALPLPSSVRDLVSQRLDHLQPAARRLLDAAAVVGRESETSVLSDMTGLDDDALLDAVSELMARQVMEETTPSRGPIRARQAA